jgi:hypothetical protein
MPDLLPPVPVDDEWLALFWAALHPGLEADRTSIFDVLRMLSEMAGSDTQRFDDVVDGVPADGVVPIASDPLYHPNDVISALIAEVRRLRGVSHEVSIAPFRLGEEVELLVMIPVDGSPPTRGYVCEVHAPPPAVWRFTVDVDGRRSAFRADQIQPATDPPPCEDAPAP